MNPPYFIKIVQVSNFSYSHQSARSPACGAGQGAGHTDRGWGAEADRRRGEEAERTEDLPARCSDETRRGEEVQGLHQSRGSNWGENCSQSVVYWCDRSTLTLRALLWLLPSPGTFLFVNKTLYSHGCSPPRCMNGYLVGCECYCGWAGMCAPKKWQLAGMLPREWRKCTVSAESIQNPMTGVIIQCEGIALILVGKAAL